MPVMTCQHRSKHSQKMCSERADALGHHAVSCKIGGHQYAVHGRSCHILQQAMFQAGYQALREQIVPELATASCPSPQLDLDGWCLQLDERLVIDFTMRHPEAQRYSGIDAMAKAFKEKHAHYPARAGVSVCAASMEVYGRFGDELAGLLEFLSHRARQRDYAFGCTPNRWLRRWRVQLSHAAAAFVGRAIQQALVVQRPA